MVVINIIAIVGVIIVVVIIVVVIIVVVIIGVVIIGVVIIVVVIIVVVIIGVVIIVVVIIVVVIIVVVIIHCHNCRCHPTRCCRGRLHRRERSQSCECGFSQRNPESPVIDDHDNSDDDDEHDVDDDHDEEGNDLIRVLPDPSPASPKDENGASPVHPAVWSTHCQVAIPDEQDFNEDPWQSMKSMTIHQNL